MKHLILGTAGHVDHGKTALIKALTGVNTDRLREEQERGISIDLGFANLVLTDDVVAGIVDVPGHERFLKNMLAGSGGIDAVMLIISAEEGVRAQTREHLAMLECLGVRHGVVVVSKIDCVDENWLAMVELEIREELANSFLAQADMCLVSSFTGEGLDLLKQSLCNMAISITERDNTAPFHMWIDRVFSLHGYGTIVTGTVLSGSISKGQLLYDMTDGNEYKVRNLQNHDKFVDCISAGQRGAINIATANRVALRRGSLLGQSNVAFKERTWDLALQSCKNIDITIRQRLRLHVGTAEYLVRVIAIHQEDDIGLVRVRGESNITAIPGSKAILRNYSPAKLVAGAQFLMPVVARGKKLTNSYSVACAWQRNDLPRLQLALLEEYGCLEKERLLQLCGINSEERWQAALKANSEDIISSGQWYWVSSFFDNCWRQIKSLLNYEHKANEQRVGLTLCKISRKLTMPLAIVEQIMLEKINTAQVKLHCGEYALIDHYSVFIEIQANDTKYYPTLLKAGFSNLNQDWLRMHYDSLAEQQLVIVWRRLISSGAIVKYGEHYWARELLLQVKEMLADYFKYNDNLSVGDFRDNWQITRKIAVPLLEYCDWIKWTVRHNDVRRSGLNLNERGL